MSIIIAEVKITNDKGLHARPAVTFSQLAKSFESDITCTVIPKAIIAFNAKSVKQVVKAKIKKNQKIRIEARGRDANYAVDAIVQLVKRDFAEE